MKYCNSLTQYSRFKTREVKVGIIGIGGDNPIRIQSMTTTNTMDTLATVEESIRMIKAGCELVRITAPSRKEAENLKNIKKELRKRGYQTPIIADIHYTPNAAEIAATIIEKVRINPGNYADKKKFEEIEYTDETYNKELDRIKEKFTPLVKICKKHGTAMRIGTNHGSLSDRILSRYGDTPKGMVESAMEFLRICRNENYHNIILSMKASNTRVMVQAYRMLVAEMIAENMDYPLHLGVTEAGEGEDGRIKSAVGIGALLADGIGDTIRVSLTEAPEFEIPVAQKLLHNFKEIEGHQKIEKITKNPLYSFTYKRRKTNEVLNIGGKNTPIVIADFCLKKKITPASFFALGYNYSVPLDKWHISEMAADYVFVGNHNIDFEVPGTLGVIYNFKKWKEYKKGYPLLTINDYLDESAISDKLNIVYSCLEDLSEELFAKLKTDNTAVLMIDTYNQNGVAEQRKLFTDLMNNNIKTPVIIGRAYCDFLEEQLQLSASSDFGTLLLDGLGDGIFIAAENCGSDQSINSLAFGILQASRTRISKTEYISCPSCGRTLFDLQETTAKIRKETDHLKGVKIGIMGCIVNGPGEMADADYGYVGTGKGKITLYKEQTVVEKNIQEDKAVTALINLIKKHGDWVEKTNLP
ncbi:MAG: 4-hydroxy-3-methylbut-2-en-1-yl diphosphate synthase [Flavobacteriales bacterium]|nr:4-hydroxy-3-methylbut-2-en-1-yl diphosphate synthase [Flavobacteriales bacterium]|tara:strand:+ start:7456 stop:9378 length:1923 start_codon:yes stop_codon:yes gene_type:complete